MRATSGDGHQSGPSVFLRGWLFFLVIAAGVLAGTFGYVQTRPSVYTSSAVVALSPKGPKPVTAAVVILTAPRYVAYATSPYALRQVAEPLGLDTADLQKNVVVTMGAATANVTIDVTLQNPQAAADVADAMARLVLKRAASDPILAAEVVSSAVKPTTPSGPNRGAILGGGAVGALLAGLAGALLVERYHRRRSAVVARGVAPVGGRVAARPASPPATAAARMVPPADLTTELAVLRDLPGSGRDRPAGADDTVLLKVDPSAFQSDAGKPPRHRATEQELREAAGAPLDGGPVGAPAGKADRTAPADLTASRTRTDAR